MRPHSIGATVAADNGSAYGAGATVNAGHTNAAAFGAGATTDRANQQVFSTKTNTYTMPGITSGASKAAQGAPTHLVTSNGAGDLAAQSISELGIAKQRDVDENTSGVAMSIAMENPDLTGNESFGVAANWGTFEDANALGLSLMGVVGRDLFTSGDRAAISGGFGIGFEEGEGDDVYGGRVGVQWTR